MEMIFRTFGQGRVFASGLVWDGCFGQLLSGLVPWDVGPDWPPKFSQEASPKGSPTPIGTLSTFIAQSD